MHRSPDLPLDEIFISRLTWQLWSPKLPVDLETRLWLENLAHFEFHGSTFKQWCEDSSRVVWLEALMTILNDERVAKFRRIADDISYIMGLRRQLFLSSEEYIGWAPVRAREGDIIALILGCSVPIVLRRRFEGGCFLAGPCFVPGFMDGEKLPEDEMQYQMFDIY